MTETKRIYISGNAQIDAILQSIADRLDTLEGLRPELDSGYIALEEDKSLTTSGLATLQVQSVTVSGNATIGGTLTLASGASINEFSTDGTLAGNSDTAAATEKAIKTYIINAEQSRPTFTYNGGSTAYTIRVGGGRYLMKDKIAYWNSELTTNAIASPVADTWYYLYLDASAITASGLVTANELIWSTTSPTFDHQYKAFYNGNDKCIFAVRTNSGPTNILEFYHDGNIIFYDEGITDRENTDLDTTWTDVALTIPSFTRKASIIFHTNAAGDTQTAYLYWRTNGSSSNGHAVAVCDADTVYASFIAPIVITDTSQIIEIRYGVSGAHQCAVYIDGWYFPTGM